jgi:hypothetical protein
VSLPPSRCSKTDGGSQPRCTCYGVSVPFAAAIAAAIGMLQGTAVAAFPVGLLFGLVALTPGRRELLTLRPSVPLVVIATVAAGALVLAALDGKVGTTTTCGTRSHNRACVPAGRRGPGDPRAPRDAHHRRTDGGGTGRHRRQGGSLSLAFLTHI